MNNLKRSISQNAKRKRYDPGKTINLLRIGSLVYIKIHQLSSAPNDYSRKLGPSYYGPFRVVYFLSPVSIIVQKVDDVMFTKRVAISDVKISVAEEKAQIRTKNPVRNKYF